MSLQIRLIAPKNDLFDTFKSNMQSLLLLLLLFVWFIFHYCIDIVANCFALMIEVFVRCTFIKLLNFNYYLINYKFVYWFIKCTLIFTKIIYLIQLFLNFFMETFLCVTYNYVFMCPYLESYLVKNIIVLAISDMSSRSSFIFLKVHSIISYYIQHILEFYNVCIISVKICSNQ